MGYAYGPMSEGVTGSEGGGGRLMRVGVDIADASNVRWQQKLLSGWSNLFSLAGRSGSLAV